MGQSQLTKAAHTTQGPDPSTLGHVPPVLVLVVDDDEAQRGLVTRLLEGAGYCVVTASNGQDAVKQASACRYDLLLMDLQMPVMDGFSAAAAIRSAERRFGSAPVPIVALSSRGGEHTRQRCLLAGMNDLLVKPVLKARLLETLELFSRVEQRAQQH